MAAQVIAPQRRADDGLLETALGIAQTVFKVRMDDKQLAKAQELANQKEKNQLTENDRKASLDFAKDFEVVQPTVAGAIDPQTAGLSLPRGINIPQGMAIRPRSIGLEEIKLAQASSEKDKDRKSDIEKALVAKQNSDSKESKITGQTAQNIGDLQTVNQSIDALWQDYQALAATTGSGVAQYFPGSDADKFNQKSRVAVQNIGYALEGGKMTDSDRDFYNQMLPKPSDNNERALAKIEALKQYAQRKFQGLKGGLEQSGFNVSGIKDNAPKQEAQSSGPTLEDLIAEKQRRMKQGTAQK